MICLGSILLFSIKILTTEVARKTLSCQLSFIAPPDGSLKKGDTFSFNEGHGQAEVLGVGTTVEEGCVYYDLNITYK